MQSFAEIIVANHVEPCPYLAGRDACLPLRFPLRNLEPEEFDACMAAGDRRAGVMLYRPNCPACRSCEAIRVLVDEFRPGRTQRRVKRRGDAEIRVEVGPPQVDAARAELFNKHRNERGLNHAEADVDEVDYAEFLVRTCCETLELAFYVDGRLIGAAICDRGRTSLSAVYCYFDPDFGRLSPGTYSILTQIELCRQWEIAHLYLGYFIADSPHMAYKSQYRPHERLIGGRWRRFDPGVDGHAPLPEGKTADIG